MSTHHISEVLEEYFKTRAREDLDSIELNGIEDFADSGGIQEIGALIELGAMTFGEVYMAQHEYLINTLWRN